MPVAAEETVTQRGSLPQNFAGPWSSLLPMQQVLNREMESGACGPASAGGSLSQGPVRRTESGVLGRCETCSFFVTGVYANAPREFGTCIHARFDVVNPTCPSEVVVRGSNAEVYVGSKFGCIHHEEKA